MKILMERKTPHELIMQTLKEKTSLKQDVFKITVDSFGLFRKIVEEKIRGLSKEMGKIDPRIVFDYRSKNEFNAEIVIGGDTIVFQAHTNVFHFDKSHPVWNFSYVKGNPLRAYCGIINIYNFLSDSIKFNRETDVGYLVGRIFINNEKHFFVEGKRQLGFLYNNFPQAVFDEASMSSVVESAILYCLDFDLFTPSYDTMKEVTVHDFMELSKNLVVTTGKRLGFKFQADSDGVE